MHEQTSLISVFISATWHTSVPCLYFEHVICLSVRLTVMLADCDHIVQQEVKNGIRHHLTYLHAIASLDQS